MQFVNNKRNYRLITSVVLILLGLGCLIIYFSSGSLVPTASKNSVITNDYVLRDTLPSDVVTYIESRVDRWSRVQQGQENTRYTIEGGLVTTSAGSYKFAIQPEGQEDVHFVTAAVTNLGNFYSITVTIDNVVQSIAN